MKCINETNRASAHERISHIVALSAAGNIYLKTVNDGAEPNNLLSLPECP